MLSRGFLLASALHCALLGVGVTTVASVQLFNKQPQHMYQPIRRTFATLIIEECNVAKLERLTTKSNKEEVMQILHECFLKNVPTI